MYFGSQIQRARVHHSEEGMAGQPGQELVVSHCIHTQEAARQARTGTWVEALSPKAPPPVMYFRKLQSPKGSFSQAASYWGPRVPTGPTEAILIISNTGGIIKTAFLI